MTPIGPRCSLVAALVVGVGVFRAQPLARANPSVNQLVPRVEFVGNRGVSGDDLRGAMTEPLTDPAAPYDQDALDRDLLLLSSYYWDHGYAMVQVDTPRIDASRNVITIPIVEGSVFTLGAIDATGDLIGGPRKILALLHLRSGQRFSRTMIAEDREAVSTYYQDLGYAYVNVVPITKLDLVKHTIGIVFEIERGKRASFEHVNLDNTTTLSDETIRRELLISPGAQFSMTDLLVGKRRIEALPHVETVVISTARGSSDDQVDVTVEISE